MEVASPNLQRAERALSMVLERSPLDPTAKKELMEKTGKRKRISQDDLGELARLSTR
jgi:hypothetical protein